MLSYGAVRAGQELISLRDCGERVVGCRLERDRGGMRVGKEKKRNRLTGLMG